MSYISGAGSVADKQVKIASTKMDGTQERVSIAFLVSQYIFFSFLPAVLPPLAPDTLGVITSDRAKINRGGRTKERVMPTLNQLIRHGREEKRRTDRTRASDQCPQKQGVRPRVSTRTPKKPNSAPRKIAKVLLSNRHDIFAHIPGEGHNSQEHSMVLIRGGKTSAGPQEEGPSASAAGPSSRVEGLPLFPDTRKRGRELVGEDFSPSDSDSDRPDPEAPPSGNAQSEPYTFHFGERRLPDLNEEAPTLHEDPSHEEIRRCIEEEASVSESELPPTNDEVPEDLRSLLLGKRKLPDLNEALSGESEKDKEALVSRIREKASEYLRIRGERASNVLRKLKNRATFAQCEKFIRKIPDFLSDKEKAPEEEDVDYDE